MNKELEALALKVAKEFTADISTHESLVDFASRFLAAVQAQQEPEVKPLPAAPKKLGGQDWDYLDYLINTTSPD